MERNQLNRGYKKKYQQSLKCVLWKDQYNWQPFRWNGITKKREDSLIKSEVKVSSLLLILHKYMLIRVLWIITYQKIERTW